MVVKPKKIRVKRVTRVALVDQGANLIPGLFKSVTGDQETLEIVPLMKSAPDEEGILRGVVYAPLMLDAHGHFMDAEGVKTACHSFGSSGMTLDVMHGATALDKAKVAVVESSLLSGTDNRYPTHDHLGRAITHEGAWVMAIQIHDEDLLNKARKGDLNEFSLSCPKGEYGFDEPSAEELALLKSAVNSTPPKTQKVSDTDMDKEQFEALTKSVGSLADSVKVLTDDATARKEKEKVDAEALAKAKTEREAKEKKDKEEKEKLDKKFDPTDPTDLRKLQFTAALNDLNESYEIESDDDIRELGGDDLNKYIEELEALKEEHGLAKAKSRKGSARTGLRKRKDTEQNGSDDFETQLRDLDKTHSTRHEAANASAMNRTQKQEA